jgi:hypothetical protein
MSDQRSIIASAQMNVCAVGHSLIVMKEIQMSYLIHLWRTIGEQNIVCHTTVYV